MNARHVRRGAFALALLVAATAPPAVAQSPAGRIEGTVVDLRTNRPLPSTSVFIQRLNIGTQTNERGTYVLVNVPAGTHVVQTRRIGFATSRQTVSVTAGQTTRANFRVSEAALSLDQVGPP